MFCNQFITIIQIAFVQDPTYSYWVVSGLLNTLLIFIEVRVIACDCSSNSKTLRPSLVY